MSSTVYSVGDRVIYYNFGHDDKSVGSLKKLRPKEVGKIVKTTATFVWIENKEKPIRYTHIYCTYITDLPENITNCIGDTNQIIDHHDKMIDINTRRIIELENTLSKYRVKKNERQENVIALLFFGTLLGISITLISVYYAQG